MWGINKTSSKHFRKHFCDSTKKRTRPTKERRRRRRRRRGHARDEHHLFETTRHVPHARGVLLGRFRHRLGHRFVQVKSRHRKVDADCIESRERCGEEVEGRGRGDREDEIGGGGDDDDVKVRVFLTTTTTRESERRRRNVMVDVVDFDV